MKWLYFDCGFVDYGEAISIVNNVWEYDKVWLYYAMLCGITHMIMKLLYKNGSGQIPNIEIKMWKYEFLHLCELFQDAILIVEMNANIK